MEITTAMIDELANLARLQFNAEQSSSIRADLQKMVAFIEKLQEIDTTGIAPLLHMGDSVNVLREDVIQGSITREEALRNAPVADGQFFKVPKVIKK